MPTKKAHRRSRRIRLGFGLLSTPFPTPRFEQLETRTLLSITTPLTIGGTTSGSFSDSDGTVVAISISGTAGTVTLTENNTDGIGNNDGVLEDGEEIGTVAITGASVNFVLTFARDNDPQAGGDEVDLGLISSDRVIRGVYTVESGDAEFNLRSFTGPGFSGPGGLHVSHILGDNDGIGLSIDNLAPQNVVQVSGTLTGDVVIARDLGGALRVRNDFDGNLIVGRDVTASGLVDAGAMAGDATVGRDFSGTLRTADATASWTIGRDFTASGTMTAGDSLGIDPGDRIDVMRHFAGSIATTTGSLRLNVEGNVTRGSSIVTATDMELAVGGSVARGATIVAGDDLTATVTGNAAGEWHGSDALDLTAARVTGTLSSHGSVTLDTAAISRASISGGGDSAITSAAPISRSSMTVLDGGLTINAPAISRSDAYSSGDLTFNTQSLFKGRFEAKDDVILNGATAVNCGFFAGSTQDDAHTGISLDGTGRIAFSHLTSLGHITGDIGMGASSSVFAAEGDILLTVNGGANNVRFDARSDLDLIVNGDVIRTNIAANAAELDITGSFRSGRMVSTGSSTVNITGDVGKTVVHQISEGLLDMTVGGQFAGVAVSRDNLTLAIDNAQNQAGPVAKTSRIHFGADAFIFIRGDLAGQVHGDRLSLVVTGDVTPTARIVTRSIAPVFTSAAGFIVEGDFSGRLFTGSFTAANTMYGGNGRVPLVSGNLTRSAVFSVAQLLSNDSSDFAVAFLGDALGQIILGSLEAGLDLEITGDAASITLGAPVMSDIIVGGHLTFFSSASFFDPIDATTGNFLDGSGLTTGTLTAGGGYTEILPLAS